MFRGPAPISGGPRERIRCSPRTIELEEERLSLVTKHFGDVPLSAITAKAIAEFQHTRHAAGIANRTINMDVGVLSRVLKSCGRWRALADHVRNLPERQHPVGRALTPEEQNQLKVFLRRLVVAFTDEQGAPSKRRAT